MAGVWARSSIYPPNHLSLSLFFCFFGRGKSYYFYALKNLSKNPPIVRTQTSPICVAHRSLFYQSRFFLLNLITFSVSLIYFIEKP